MEGFIDKLPPFAEGWYFIASRDSIQREKLIQRTWLGEEIVVWCDQKGRICVADATCPHLGSSLGPVAGGKVREGCLVCPLHGRVFDASGQCVATPDGPATGNERLRVYETREILGMVFAWWGSGGRPSQWQLPDEPHTGVEWCKVGFRHLRFPGHIVDMAENSVDFGHLSYIHGYDEVTPIGSLSVSGAYLRTRFDFKRVRTFAGIELKYDVSTVTHVHGLGYSFVEIHEKTIGLHARYWVLATPVDSERIHLVLANQVREIHKPRRSIMGLGFLPLKLRHSVMNQILLTQQKRDVRQDVVIWARKRYLLQPQLCRSDGPIGAYRRYCRQFYPGPGVSGAQ